MVSERTAMKSRSRLLISLNRSCIMGDINERLDRLKLKIQTEDFLWGKGLSMGKTRTDFSCVAKGVAISSHCEASGGFTSKI